MIVYRLCNEEEGTKILNGEDFQNIGKPFTKRITANDFNYLEGEKYLHFFKRKDNIFYLRIREGKYICTYDIPDDILKTSEGTGRYHNYIYSHIIDEVPEYAINCKLLKPEYIVKIERLLVHITPDDFFEDMDLNDYVETMYEKAPSQKTK